MRKFVHVLLPTGHLYEIPTATIAANRAAFYHAQISVEFPTLEDAQKDTEELFEDNTEVRDWAINNMNVPELMKDARLVRFTPPEMDFAAGDWSFHEHAAMIPQLESQTMLAQPLEMSVSAMAAHNNLCQILILNDDGGEPAAAVVLVRGPAAIVGTYVGALQHLTNVVTQVPADQAANPN